jgi:RNA polymerase sigma-70 factor (ECF subfamily)
MDAVVEACLAGDQSAYATLYEGCAPMILRLCNGILLNAEDAEDVVQESFVYAFKNLGRYDSSRASFKTWLYTIALSRCRNLYRRGHWRHFMGLIGLELTAPAQETPEACYADSHARGVIEAALRQLSPRLREAVILRYGHGLTFREMAEIMDCPQKTAESRVRLAHEQLRVILKPASALLLEELIGTAL